LEEKDNKNPTQDWSNFHSDASQILGEEFWKDISELIPITGPRIDIYYTSTTVVVLVEVPGIQSPDQISIFLEGQLLVVEGEIPRLYPVSEKRITQKERFFGSFRRALPMPKPIFKDSIHATYIQGLLIIELQIEHSVQLTHIPINFL
jgi:HSP20 family protein